MWRWAADRRRGLARPSRCAPTCRRSSFPRPMPDRRRRRFSARPRTATKRRSPTQRVQPEVILYDAELVRGLPVGMTVASGLNAMAHAAEALYAQGSQSAVDRARAGGLAAFVRSLAQGRGEPRTTWLRAAKPCMAPGFAGPCWGRWAWRCTTSFVTLWAGASICLMQRHTRSSCRTRWPTTPGGARLLAPLAELLGTETMHDFARAHWRTARPARSGTEGRRSRPCRADRDAEPLLEPPTGRTGADPRHVAVGLGRRAPEA